ncbi:hypothetical protein ACF0H5_006922 [Mactra antiquata]
MNVCSGRLLTYCRSLGTTYARYQHFHHVDVRRLSLSVVGCQERSLGYLASNNLQSRLSVYNNIHQNVQKRNLYSSSLFNSSKETKAVDQDNKTDNKKPKTEEKLSVFQRFKKTYKEHGKVLIVVHLVTSTVWFGSFFYAAKVGVDIIPFMEWLGISEKIISPFRSSSLGDIALAYLMYKLATPARYTVTLAGTNYAIKYLRKVGKMQPKSESSSLRSLARDSRTELKEKRKAMKRKTSKQTYRMQSKMKNELKEMKSEMKERRAYVKATFTKFRSKLRERHNKNKSSPFRK